MWIRDVPRPATTIPRMILDTAATYPERPCVADGRRSLTYAEFESEVVRLSNSLMSLGVRRGDSVALWLPNHVEWITANVAIMATGGVCVPINTRLKAAEARYQLDRSEAAVLITCESFKTNHFRQMLESLGFGRGPSPSPRESTPGAPDSLAHLRTVVSVDGSIPWAEPYGGLVARASDVIGADLRSRLDDGTPDDPATLFWT